MDKRIKPLQDGTASYRTADAVQYVDSTPHNDTNKRNHLLVHITSRNLTVNTARIRVTGLSPGCRSTGL